MKYSEISLNNDISLNELLCELMLKEMDLDVYMYDLHDKGSVLKLIAILLLKIRDYERSIDEYELLEECGKRG